MEESRTTPEKLSIRDWAADDRPRERLMTLGPTALSEAELLTILIRTGTVKHSALDIAKRILADHNNDLDRVARLSMADLMKYKGMGEAKAITNAAALELGRRRKDKLAEERPTIKASVDAFRELHPVLADKVNEEFWLLLLDRGNRVTGRCQISDGGMHGTVADPKRIFKEAIDRRAAGMVLAHNHPSGQLKPSEEDIALTRKLVEGGRMLDIAVQDHLIITTHGYFSFADQGML